MKSFQKASKVGKILTIVSTAVAIVAFALTIAFLARLPKDKEIASADGEKYTTILSLKDDEWLYTTTESVFVVDGDERIKDGANVVEKVNRDYNLEAGTITFSYARTNGENIYIATATSSGGYLLKLDVGLNVKEVVEYRGLVKKMLESDDGKDFYLFSGVDAAIEIDKYSAENLSEGIRQKGYIYTMLSGEGDTYRLTYARDFRVLSASVTDDKLYVVHPNGVIVMSTDFRYNSYEYRIGMETERIYGELVAEQTEEYDEAELRSQAQAAAYELLGVVSVNDKTTTVKQSEYDLSGYCTYIASAMTYRGGVYVKNDDRFYAVAEDSRLYYIDREALNAQRINSILPKQYVEGITLAGTPESSYTSLLYDEASNTAYVIYQASDLISRIDFDKLKLDFTIRADFGVSSVIQNSDGNKVFYFFYNKNVATSNQLKMSEVLKKANESLIKALSIASAIVLAISLAWAVLSWMCVLKSGFGKKLKKLWIDMKKAKWIYLALLVPMALLIAFCYYETIASVVLSFFDYTTSDPSRNWNNFKNYLDIFTNAETLKSFRNMLFFLAFDLFTSIIPPIMFAFFLTTMKNRKYSGFTRTMLFIPGVIPNIAGLLIWSTGIFGQYGVISSLMQALGGTPINVLASSKTARWALVFMGFPYVGGYLIFYGAMMNIPESYHEAAELEGIGIFGRLFKIDIPLIAPQIKYIFVTMFIHSVQNFARTYTTVGDNMSINTDVITPVHYMYRNVVSGNYGIASAYATIIFVFLFIATYINFRKKKEDLGGC